MKLLTFLKDGKEQAGILNRSEKAIIPLKALLEKSGIHTVMDIAGLAALGDPAFLEALREIRDRFDYEEIPLEAAKLCAPIPWPVRNLICLGTNYRDHVREVKKAYPNSKIDIPRAPIYFSKAAWPAIGHGDPIPAHKGLTEQLDYEVELAVVIGKDGRDIPAEKAEEHVFGYTIVNDVTAREMQARRNQWFKGKSLDGFSPMGPWIVTADEIPFPVHLDMKAWVNGELRQDSNSDQLIFDIPAIIEDLSKGTTLRAGDIILTGTPAGVGLGFNPPLYLQPGDVVKCWIEKIGTLENPVA